MTSQPAGTAGSEQAGKSEITDGPAGYRIAILGGGPAGYEAALVAVELGASVTLIERDGMGGACVLTDCVPSKALIATAELLSSVSGSAQLGVDYGSAAVEAARLNQRVRELAGTQSDDIRDRVAGEGVEVISGRARLVGPHTVEIAEKAEVEESTDVDGQQGATRLIDADVILLAVGATPREIPGSEPDGKRILSWRQLYELPELPEHLIVVGSGVTGAEFASAYRALGCEVTLVSSRDRVLPGEDADAAAVLEDVFNRRGITVMNKSRADSVRVLEQSSDDAGSGVEVTLTSGDTVRGSHVLIAIGSIPQTADLGLDEAGVRVSDSGHIEVDRVSRTSVPGIYAAGDCTGVLPLASVAAMQGRIAMWHALGEAVSPLRLSVVSANVFTDPEIATVGVSQSQVESGAVAAEVVHLPLATNARAKMEGLRDGFVKLFVRPGVGTVLGGVVVAPRASELILPITMAVQHSLSAEQVAHTFAIYPSLSGSLTEAARQLMSHEEAALAG